MIEQDFNYMDDVELLLAKKREQLLDNKEFSNKAEIFRTNFLAFEKIVSFYKRNPSLGKELGESAAGEIKKILLAKKHIKALDDISNAQVNNYMSDARAFYNQGKKNNRAAQNSKNAKSRYIGTEAVQAENFDRGSLPGQVDDNKAVEVVDASPRHQKDWLDTSWIDAEPNWTQLTTVGGERPGSEGWSDDWENVWRHLYKKADEAGYNEHEKTTYAAFKVMGADIGALWLDLSKYRRGYQNQNGWNPYGVGKAKPNLS